MVQAPVFIAAVVDRYKAGLGVGQAGTEPVFQRSLEGILAAVSDAGIATSTLRTAARAFGLGIVPIGRLRRDHKQRSIYWGHHRTHFPFRWSRARLCC